MASHRFPNARQGFPALAYKPRLKEQLYARYEIALVVVHVKDGMHGGVLNRCGFWWRCGLEVYIGI